MTRNEQERVNKLLQAAEEDQGRLEGVAAAWVRDCWVASIQAANRRKRLNRRFHLACRYVAYTGALVLPILTGVTAVNASSSVRVWTFAVSLVVAVATGALQVFKFGQQWRIHEEFAAAMEAEGWSYFQRLGPYRDAGDNAYALFFERVKTLRQRRGTQFIQEVGADIANLEGPDDGSTGAPMHEDKSNAAAVGRR